MLKNCSHLISSSQSHRQNVTQFPHEQAILLQCTFINIFCVWNVLEQSSEEERIKLPCPGTAAILKMSSRHGYWSNLAPHYFTAKK